MTKYSRHTNPYWLHNFEECQNQNPHFSRDIMMPTLSPPSSITRLSSPAANQSSIPPSIFSSNQSSTLSTKNPSWCGRDTICFPSISDHITSPGMPASRVKFSKDTWGLTVALSTNASVRKCLTSSSVILPHLTSETPCW